jgi:hypothetical protein
LAFAGDRLKGAEEHDRDDGAVLDGSLPRRQSGVDEAEGTAEVLPGFSQESGRSDGIAVGRKCDGTYACGELVFHFALTIECKEVFEISSDHSGVTEDMG